MCLYCALCTNNKTTLLLILIPGIVLRQRTRCLNSPRMKTLEQIPHRLLFPRPSVSTRSRREAPNHLAHLSLIRPSSTRPSRGRLHRPKTTSVWPPRPLRAFLCLPRCAFLPGFVMSALRSSFCLFSWLLRFFCIGKQRPPSTATPFLPAITAHSPPA